MLAYVRVMFPLFPLLVGACLGALAAAALRPRGRNRARIAELKARIEALERKP
jgi:hypothetical protein